MYNVEAGDDSSYSESLQSKYTVADILSSMANSGAETPISFASVTSPDFTTFSPTLATTTLTPTTIASLEQSFIELQSMPTATAPQGYMPPIQAPVTIKSEYPDWNDSEWMPQSAKRGRYNGPNMSSLVQNTPNYGSPYSPTLSVVSSSSSCSSVTQRRLPGPRRHYKDEKLSPVESERRKVRRERNKLAAAKCRQRRVDQTNVLVTETECLEDEQCDLKNELQRLQREKDELEFVLQAHKLRCKHNTSRTTTSNCRDNGGMKMEKGCADVDGACTLDLSVTMATTSMKQPPALMSRPTSLALPSRTSATSMTDALGVSLTTPSGGLFTFGLESMVDGHTGLTPITGAPSCATQAQRSSSESSTSDVMSSPASLMAL